VPDPKNTSEEISRAAYPPRWDFNKVERILLIRLRSIGDAVLTTPSLTALRRFLPAAQIDVLLEDWVAPVLEGIDAADNIITFSPENIFARLKLARRLRANGYDIVYNLHGGTTSTFLAYASGARHRVGFGHYRYSFLYNHLAIPALEFWGREKLHSAEQLLALLGWTGVPVSTELKTSLKVTKEADEKIAAKLKAAGIAEGSAFALIHPAAAFSSKQWAAEKFAAVAEYLSGKGIGTAAVAAPNEEAVLRAVRESASVPVQTFSDLNLQEITALAGRAKLFIGNDSGIAHIAAAMRKPCVVIFGPSNIDHWRPYTDAPNEVVKAENDIEKVSVGMVIEAIEKVLE
jgi:lipopolysaccharide heptosyltransferase II